MSQIERQGQPLKNDFLGSWACASPFTLIAYCDNCSQRHHMGFQADRTNILPVKAGSCCFYGTAFYHNLQ